jgi:hypothetical protein
MFHLGLTVKDATIEMQYQVAYPSAASSTSPVFKSVPIKYPVSNDALIADFRINTIDPLPSVEQKLRVLDAALVALEKPGLSTAEASRLNKIIQGVKIYQRLFADYVNYRDLETELIAIRRQLKLENNRSQNRKRYDCINLLNSKSKRKQPQK